MILCSCGRADCEVGMDLCRWCREEHEARQYAREQEETYYASQQAEYEAWRRETDGLL